MWRPFLNLFVENEISCKLTYSWNLVVKFHWQFIKQVSRWWNLWYLTMFLEDNVHSLQIIFHVFTQPAKEFHSFVLKDRYARFAEVVWLGVLPNYDWINFFIICSITSVIIYLKFQNPLSPNLLTIKMYYLVTPFSFLFQFFKLIHTSKSRYIQFNKINCTFLVHKIILHSAAWALICLPLFYRQTLTLDVLYINVWICIKK